MMRRLNATAVGMIAIVWACLLSRGCIARGSEIVIEGAAPYSSWSQSPPPAPATVTSEWHPADRLVAGPARGGFLYADDLPAGQQPTPMTGVTAGLNELGPLAGKRLVVFGSGFDARWEITAARREPTLQVTGVEIDPAVADSARAYVRKAGLQDRITIITGDAITTDVRADIGAAYLWPETLTELRPKIQKLERFVSYSHAVPGLAMHQTGDVFVYTKPKPTTQAVAQVMQAFRQPTAVWNGREYSHPVCNRPGCTMCNAIRAQLATQPRQSSSGYWKKVCQNGVCRMVWVSN